jgi:hypothetical protein
VRFSVADGRPAEEKTLRRPEFKVPMDPIERFGDDQFVTDRVRALASFFAEAFPEAPTQPGLTVTQFEVAMFFPKSMAASRAASVAAVSYAAAIGLASGTEKMNDWMICQLKGTFNGVPFEVVSKVPFEYRGRQPENAVPVVLRMAFVAAIEQVRRQARGGPT